MGGGGIYLILRPPSFPYLSLVEIATKLPIKSTYFLLESISDQIALKMEAACFPETSEKPVTLHSVILRKTTISATPAEKKTLKTYIN